jgi:hypothetical protein
VEAAAIARPVKTGRSEGAVAGSPLPLRVDSSGPVIGIGRAKQGEAGPSEASVIVVDVVPRAVMNTREEKTATRARVAAEVRLHLLSFRLLSALVAAMLMGN